MRRWVMVALVMLVLVFVAGIILVTVQRNRLAADRLQCQYRFEQLGQFAALYSQNTAALEPGEVLPPEVPLAIPPGTIPNTKLPPEQRLSWVCDILPFLDNHSQDTSTLYASIDRNLPWDVYPNAEASTTILKLLICPGAVPDIAADQPAPTQFIGLSGLGRDSAELPIARSIPPRAGCFRYDTPTRLALIRDNDGLSATFLFSETANELGPWIRGGLSTVRGLEVGDGAKPPLGRGGQFGGNYPEVVGFGRADGSATWVRVGVNPIILRAHFTIAGGELDTLADDY